MSWKTIDELPIALAGEAERYKSLEIIVSDGFTVTTGEFITGWYSGKSWYKFDESGNKLEFAVTKWQYMPEV